MKVREALTGKFFLDSVWMFIAYGFVALSGILINYILGHFYGPDAVGVFNQAYSLFQIFAVAGAMGINFSTVKHVAEFKDDREKVVKIFSTSQVVTFVCSSLVAMVIIAVISLFPSLMSSENVRISTILITISLPFFVTNKNTWSYYIGFRRMKEYSLFRLYRYIMTIIIIGAWTIFKMPMVYAVLSFAITDIIMSVYLHAINRKAFSVKEISREWAGIHLSFGAKSILTEVISSVYARMPIIIVGYYLGDRDSGMYSIASTMASGILIIASILQDNFNPVVANLHGTGDTTMLNNYVRKLRKFSYLSLIPLIAGSVVIYKIYILFLGSEYKETSVIYNILIIGVAMTYLVSWAGGVLTMTGNQMLNLLRIAITLVFAVVGCIILVPLMGVIGAAVSFSFSALVNMIVLYIFILNRAKIKIL